MAKLCTHMPHLDLVDIGQNMSATDRLMGTPNPMKKFSNRLTLQPRNPKIHGNVPSFRLDKNFFILTLHTHRQSLDWPLISILTSQPIHEVCSGPWKTSHMFSIYKKTVNRKTSLLSLGLSLRFFLLKISLISTYKMPPRLLSNLLKALRYSSGNIRNIGISSCHNMEFSDRKWCHSLICIRSIPTRRPKMADFVRRIGNFSNIPTLVSQHSYQISSQTRWHPLAPDKTLLQ